MKRNILLVYAYAVYPMRPTTWEHLRCFGEYSEDNVYYLNLAFKSLPSYLENIKFDLIIFDTLFLAQHWGGVAHFRRLMARADKLKQYDSVRVMLPQDEFYNSDLYLEFIRELKIDYVFSVAPERAWPQIYKGVDFEKVKFVRILTGYIDEKRLLAIQHLARAGAERPIDICYRLSARPYYWFGRHGMLKQKIAEFFLEQLRDSDLALDISLDNKDTITGDAWYEFLSRSKYTIGVEGGTSMIDSGGSIREKTEQYLACHPGASFEEVEKEVFPGVDGSVDLFALSPRHLEACVTRTCQILLEGDYSGVLDAGRHYIELKRDFSNMKEVIAAIKSPETWERITGSAYKDIVESGKYTYRSFVKEIVERSLESRMQPESHDDKHGRGRLDGYYRWRMSVVERIEWALIRLYCTFLKPIVRMAR